ncbi:MAG TPA: menaquinone biosynthesis protein [Chitinophagales bacterium]|nr:menaquinone biosynthesis protein [Chitinophagales bacterium]
MLKEKVRVAAVSYLNTKPFLFGLRNSPLISSVQLELQHPSMIAKQLLNHEIDLGLVPVAVIPRLREAHIISDFGICCDGEVSSVVICSQVPLNEAEKLFLDYQSRTSSALAQLLLKDYWKVNPRIVQASPGYEKQVMGKYAGLFIGDRALKLKERYDYCFDLGVAWKKFTGMPFVFACWISNKKLDDDFLRSFNQALSNGVTHLDEVIAEQQLLYPDVDVRDYLSTKIQFVLNEEKKQALKHFLQLIEKQQVALS